MVEIDAVRVTNFRSIEDSGWVEMEPDITCLVGGNEAGKSNFLEALEFFSQSGELDYGDLCQYSIKPDNDVKEEIPIVKVQCSGVRLDQLYNPHTFDQFPFEDLIHGIIFTKFANGDYTLSFADDFNTKVPLAGQRKTAADDDFSEQQKMIITEAQSMYFINEVLAILDDLPFGRALRNKLSDEVMQQTGLKVDSDTPFRNQPRIVSLYLDHLFEFVNEDEEQHHEMFDTNYIRELMENADDILSTPNKVPFAYVRDMVPTFHLVKNVGQINDGIKLSEFDDTHSPYKTLLSFSGLSSDEIRTNSYSKNRTKRLKANQMMTNLFNEFWNQPDNLVEISLELSGGFASLHIKDNSKAENQPTDRSTGFRWFLSFIIDIMPKVGEELENKVVLFDDPGVHLHPKGHEDLLEVFRNITEENQIVYSTHSPYLIDKENLQQVRIVKRENGDGTSTKVTRMSGSNSPSPDSLRPIRAALGATFSKSLFASHSTVLVEGWEDRVYLNRFSDYFRRTGEGPSLDPNVAIVDCGGASKTDYLARLVDAEDYNFTVFLDGDQPGREARKALLESEVNPDRIHLVTDFLEDYEGDDATIEDYFAPEFFCEIAAEVHDNELSQEDFEEAAEQRHGKITSKLNGALKAERDGNPEGWVLNKRGIAETIDGRVLRSNQDDKCIIPNETLGYFKNTIAALNDSLEESRTTETVATSAN